VCSDTHGLKKYQQRTQTKSESTQLESLPMTPIIPCSHVGSPELADGKDMTQRSVAPLRIIIVT